MFYLYIADKYLGNRLLSYGHTLSVSFTAELEELLPRSVTVILEGSGLSATADLYFQQESYSSLEKTPINTFTLRCVEWVCYSLLFANMLADSEYIAEIWHMG